MSSNDDTQRNANSKARQKNAQVHQDRDHAAKIVHSQFDNIGLTKRNAEYMFKFNQALGATKLSADKKNEAVQTMVQELLEGQKSGKTARNMWGTVDQKIETTVHPPARPADPRRDYWKNAGYNAVLFLTIFFLMYGVLWFLPTKGGQHSPMMGITGILISAAVAGLGIPIVTMMFTPGVKHRFSIWIRIILVVLFLIVWMGIFTLSSILPPVLNPVLNPIVYIVLGVLSGVAAFFVKRRFNITGGVF
ncbi:DUF1129 family protein [Lentilactobacillus buchneri]|uniref:DUF1129 domain-containing protein n=1 Tax=Lentilactobacillus buchneri subsp. silagei CD034 TaxID=1071400 RepID=J9VZB6_LENBU|nr:MULTISPECIES: DUF1129 family protein [Lentilactobacillus]MCC6101261.1 DUF1129 domain-containing protein [Lactobacillus sp.]AEB72860.1 hypothetical protein Lbuc_0594 [Lentilactobacillus buchneri NRRL B-30929]AFR99707.1 hypothetical protein LBUCD034_0611 [Lentilactobacillus buchneri subsp. silagei CD034]MCT2882917.1 DUF1129 domain-containing protein [Lentilactobacillus buchneri]MCT2897803.1 DUF1129 domain-containing protein [Lentilactobacillus buchneri]